jgi:hypothetical protein
MVHEYRQLGLDLSVFAAGLTSRRRKPVSCGQPDFPADFFAEESARQPTQALITELSDRA